MKIKEIYIPQLLKMPEKTQKMIVDDQIEGIQTLTPIRGNLSVAHRGNFLEVELEVETIVTLTCDRCLQTYNHRLKVETEEIIWLSYETEEEQNIPLEREIASEDLCETLNPDGYFALENWLYEQVSLAMPLRQLCGNDCQPPSNPNKVESETIIDDRWSVLAHLKSIN